VQLFTKKSESSNGEKSVSDILFRIRFPFESSFWISLSGCKLIILPYIQPANRIVIISALHLYPLQTREQTKKELPNSYIKLLTCRHLIVRFSQKTRAWSRSKSL